MSKILIADDSTFMRKLLVDVLLKNGYSDIVEAENGNVAVALYNSEQPALVLLDIIMPEKDGLEVLAELAPKGANIIMISAVGQDKMISQAKDTGAKGYIVKPFDEDQVIDEVKKYI
jgi:two-component system, chemotaxis family, chemotaxis protein CheY